MLLYAGGTEDERLLVWGDDVDVRGDVEEEGSGWGQADMVLVVDGRREVMSRVERQAAARAHVF